MDKVKFHDKQELTLNDMVAAQDYVEAEFARLVREFLTGESVVVAGLAVEARNPAAFAVEVTIDPDLGWGLAIDPQTGKPVRLGANAVVSGFAAADPAHPRIDVVAARRAREQSDQESRVFWDEALGQTYEESVFTRELDDCELVVIQGTAAAEPVAPTEYQGAPIGDNYVVLAEVYIAALAGVINEENITDRRTMFLRPRLAAGSIENQHLATGAVSGPKLATGAVTGAKVADYTLGNDKLERVRRAFTELTSSYQDLWPDDTRDWLGSHVLIYLARQPAGWALVQSGALLELAAAETDYTAGSLSGETVSVRVNTSGRLEFKTSTGSLPGVYLRVEEA